MVVRGELFWEELEVRRLLSTGCALAEDVRSGKGGAELLREVVHACRRRLEELKGSDKSWKEGLGNPNASTLNEYERRMREIELAYEEVRGMDSGPVPQVQELLGLRNRKFGGPGTTESVGREELEAVERQQEVADELVNLLLVKVSNMRQGAEVLNEKIKESNEVVEDMDQLVDSNVEQMKGLRGNLGKYTRASWFASFRAYFLLAIAILVWVGVVMFLVVIR